jgi:translation initiation factor IF-1
MLAFNETIPATSNTPDYVSAFAAVDFRGIGQIEAEIRFEPLARDVERGPLGYTESGFGCPDGRPSNCGHGRKMSKEDCIEMTGTVVEKFPSGLFSVQIDQERIVLAHLAGKLRRNRIRVLAGDRVTIEMSPYDLTKGRITYRHK